MLNTIEFQGLKFKTSFNFNSRKQRHTYFNDLLVKSTYNFQEKQKEYFSEKLHVVFSYYMSFKVAAYIILGLALISPSFKVAIAVAAIVTFLTSLMLNRKFQNDYFGYSFTIAMNEDPDFISILKEETINSK